MFTAPFGFNQFLDDEIRKGLGMTEIHFLKRMSNTVWVESSYEEIYDLKYGYPHKCANALIIGIYKNLKG